MSQDNIIELNGKRYDALSGKLLGESSVPVVEQLAPPSSPKRLRSMDGMMSARRAEKSAKTTVKSSLKPQTVKIRHLSPGSTVTAHHPQKAKTLMRRAVHKPKTSMKPAIKPQSPSEVMAAPIAAITHKRAAKRVDPIRMQRANQTPKHGRVARFTRSASQQPTAAAPTYHQAPAKHVVAPLPHHVQPAKQPTKHKDIFESAIASARSHEQPAHKAPKTHKKHRRLVSTLAGILAFLVLGGFFTYLNMPQLELKFASVQAGFNARMPDYNPTGYKLADIANNHGIVELSFRSGESSYRIRQQASNWNSQTLQDDLIASAEHQTVESKGRIIYLHQDTASWVDGGVRYDITVDAHLSKDDIVNIATSM